MRFSLQKSRKFLASEMSKIAAGYVLSLYFWRKKKSSIDKGR